MCGVWLSQIVITKSYVWPMKPPNYETLCFVAQTPTLGLKGSKLDRMPYDLTFYVTRYNYIRSYLLTSSYNRPRHRPTSGHPFQQCPH